MAVSGIAVAAVAAGSISVYAGIKGISIPQVVQAIVQGQSPATLAQANPISSELASAGAKVAAGAAAAARKAGATPQPDLPHNSGGASKATPPTVGANPLPRLPVVAPPRQTTPQTKLTAPPKKKSGSVWWKPWTW